MIIIEMGSGNTCQNDIKKTKDMIDAVADVDTGKHELVLKWQLFKNAPPNNPLDRVVFEYAHRHALNRGYNTTASVCDIESLLYLDTFNPLFIKLAARRSLWHLGRLSRYPVIASCNDNIEYSQIKDWAYPLCCVSEYPADKEKYNRFWGYYLNLGISDHTEGFDLFHEWNPAIYEKHFVLEHDSDNPDGGIFSATPKEFEEIL